MAYFVSGNSCVTIESLFSFTVHPDNEMPIPLPVLWIEPNDWQLFSASLVAYQVRHFEEVSSIVLGNFAPCHITG